jgi:hypothetical protein
MTQIALLVRHSRLTGSIRGGDTLRMMTAKTVRIACWWRAPLKEWALVV